MLANAKCASLSSHPEEKTNNTNKQTTNKLNNNLTEKLIRPDPLFEKDSCIDF